jgi:hypothetical protein
MRATNHSGHGNYGVHQCNSNMLLPYMHPNLAYVSQLWVAQILLSGQIILLPGHIQHTQAKSTFTAPTIPRELISWNGESAHPQIKHRSSSSLSCTIQQVNLVNIPQPIILDRVQTPDSQTLPPRSDKPGEEHTYTTPSSSDTNRHQPQGSLSQIVAPPAVPKTQQYVPLSSRIPKVKRTIKLVRPPTQLTLHDVSFTQKKGEDRGMVQTWGHNAVEIERNTSFRIILQNPRGLKLSTETLNTQYSFSICQDMEAGAICLPETNVNWGHKQAHSSLYNILRKTWKHSTYATSYTKEDFQGLSQPGGTATVITNNWTSRVLERGTDPFSLGRWSYFILRWAQGRRILLVTAYRVCKQTMA